MNKILKYAGIPAILTCLWGCYLFIPYFMFGIKIESWKGFVLLGMMVVVVATCEIVLPSSGRRN